MRKKERQRRDNSGRRVEEEGMVVYSQIKVPERGTANVLSKLQPEERFMLTTDII